MKNFFLLAFFLSGGLTAISQITITDSDFPSAGDTAMISISDELTLDLVTTGANTTWDFTGLNITAQRIDTFHNIWSAPITYQAIFNNFVTDPDYAADFYSNLIGFNFPGAGMAGVSVSNPVSFTKVTSSEYQSLGMGVNMNGINVPAKADTIDVVYELPINFNDSWVSFSYMNMDLNPAYNGIFRRHQVRSANVDGWGSISTDYGTFDVIRIKSEVTYVDSVYVDFAGGMWVNLPTPAQTEYVWMTNGQKVPILRVVTDNSGAGDVISRVEFKDFDRGYLATEEVEMIDGNLYPNPVAETLNISVLQGTETIEIYSLSGELIYVNSQPEMHLKIDVTSWSPGTYITKFVSSQGVSMERFIVQ